MDIIAWSNNFAYGVGLLATDGCLSSDNRHIEFSSKDKERVANFKECFRITNRITLKRRGTFPKTQCYRVQFGNVKLYDFLIKIGLYPHKSHTLRELKIPKKFFADFLRGVIDGDGCIDYFMHSESEEKQFRIRIASASRNFFEWLSYMLSGLLHIKRNIQCTSKYCQLCYYKKAFRRLVKFIYLGPNIIFIKRKRLVAELLEKREW